MDSFVFQYINNAGNKDNIKIEINYSDRIHILDLNAAYINALNYLGSVEIKYLNKFELYGSKLAALIGRSKPRDIFDVYYAIENAIICKSDLLRKCFIFYNCVGGDCSILDRNYSKIDSVMKHEFDMALKPVLPKTLLFKEQPAIKTIKDFLDELLVFSDEEKNFVTLFKEGVYKPELLFNGESSVYAEALSRHPMALWRCKLGANK